MCTKPRFIPYFKENDIKITVVDRDPRDVFLLGKKFQSNVFPKKDVKKFCEWYEWTRSIFYKDEQPKEVLLLNFEDLVYDYENSRRRIFEHFGIDQIHHTPQFKYFNPEKSIANTQVWRLYPQYSQDINYIEKHLSKYLYDFPYKINIDENKMFDC